ncbi:MAG: Energy-coupling factor transporter transmembrane protein EcfT [Methanonatronarchaeales archaeon]|nr:Energy-coupling factor transporter transmembrane protein EcfT [Methanonatronarchaeales archaeon]
MLEFDETVEGAWLGGLDPAWKLLSTVLLVVAVSSLGDPAHAALALLLVLVAGAAGGVPVRLLLRGLRNGVLVAAVVSLVHPFTYGKTVIHVIGPFAVYREGLTFAAALFLKVLASISLLGLFALTTSASDVVRGIRRLGLPHPVPDVALLTIRFSHTLSREAVTVRRAQRARLGEGDGFIERVTSSGDAAGKLLLRALDRSSTVYRAMLSRGYGFD